MNARMRRLLIGTTVGAFGLGAVATIAGPASAQAGSWPASGAADLAASRPVPLTASAPSPPPRGAVRLGPLAPSRVIHLDVTLNLRDPAALTAFIAATSNRGSPLFDHFLRRGQFGARFGLRLSSISAVRSAPRRAGLRPGPTSSDRLLIPVTATAAAVEHAFGISLLRYRLPGGQVGYSNSAPPKIPVALAPDVAGVIGLSNLYREHNMLVRQSPGSRRATGPGPASSSGPRPCSAAARVGSRMGGFTANQLASHYFMTGLYRLRDLGHGIHVALLELEPNRPSDISAYEHCYGVKTSVHYFNVDGGAGSGAGSGEATLDIEDVIGLSPAITVDVYRAPNNTLTNALDDFRAIVKADRDGVISTSWGVCEADITNSFAQLEQNVFAEAAAQGQTVLAAAGDTGSTGCRTSTGALPTLSAGDPASQPLVVGVGGTRIERTGEVVWNESARFAGAGGGGLSSIWCMPTYQYQPTIPGLIGPHSMTNNGCPTATGKHIRQGPDVSADADPFSGYVIFFKGHWGVIGGTSAAAPLWASIAALIDASPFCAAYGSGHPGVRPKGLYAMAATDHAYIYGKVAEALHDVTKGNNDYTPSGNFSGLYPAAKGFDMASGLGTPLLTGVVRGKSNLFFPGLAAIMCQAYQTKLKTVTVTGVSPRIGPGRGGQLVTITGKGFLPVSGADRAYFGTTWVTATCKTTTKCTVVTPKHAAGQVNVVMIVEDTLKSAITKADLYRFR
jgi:subtilase family serine protease